MAIDKVVFEIERREAEWIERLTEMVAIESVSAFPEKRPEVFKQAEWIKKEILSIFPETKVMFTDLGTHVHETGAELPLPPIVRAEVGHDPAKKTLLVYAHYDVQPAHKSDGWDTEPFVLTRQGDELRGRGSSDDKGPLLGWLNVLRVYKDLGKPLPVNLKFIFEGMEESASVGFDAAIEKMPEWFKGIDYCCVSDNYWLTTDQPALTYGTRGLLGVMVHISGPKVDMHSGSFGGQVYQPMDDLIAILSSVKDKDEKILIDGIYDDVLPVTEGESKLYEKIDIDFTEQAKVVGVPKVRHADNKTQCLMNTWRNPALTIHGIEGAFSEPGFKTVIPSSVTGKFSIRIVPNQTADQLEACVRKHLEKVFAAQNSPNTMHITVTFGTWFYVDPLNSAVFKAAQKAIETVHNQHPAYTREGGSIPVLVTMSRLAGADLCLLPMGRCDDRAHAQNEKLNVSNYIKGMQVFAHFLETLAL